MSALQTLPSAADEVDMVRRAAAGDAAAVRAIIRTHNQRLYRLVRAVVRSNADAEDVLQEAYLSAFARLDTSRARLRYRPGCRASRSMPR